MSGASRKRSEEFLRIAGQFKLGALVTESSHPATARLSEAASRDLAAALGLLFDADVDVVRKFREFAASGRAEAIVAAVLSAIRNGGRIFFTGCGATGRLSILLDSVWRDFWQRSSRGNEAQTEIGNRQSAIGNRSEPPHVGCYRDLEHRTFSVMAGGDYALIKSVEGFEDFTEFGKKQIRDLGVSTRDVVFAITEGGETSFVIGTAWAGVEVGAKVYFVYNNPDEVLCAHVQRSREVIRDARIEKLNLTTGPMAITGSTRMQATSIQLCVMLTILEMVVRELCKTVAAPVSNQRASQGGTERGDGVEGCPTQFLAALEQLHAGLKSPELLEQLAELVAMEATAYRAGGKCNYFADGFGIDVLTDTTERSPTFCTPPFRKFDDATASESWAFLFLPQTEAAQAWRNILKREPRCLDWNEAAVRSLGGDDNAARTMETLRKISLAELMRFKVGLDGLPYRVLKQGDAAIGVVSEAEKDTLLSPDSFYRVQLNAAQKAGAKTGLIYFGREERQPLNGEIPDCLSVFVPLPPTDFLLDGVARVAVKLVLNALSTCTMTRLGRVLGNTMIWVVPSNLKLIDRATRYIAHLTDLTYEAANALLFEIFEYVEPRMKTDQAYPPVVAMAVLRAREKLTNEEAEVKLARTSQPQGT